MEHSRQSAGTFGRGQDIVGHDLEPGCHRLMAAAEMTVGAIPEPASLALLGLGAAVLSRRRRA